MGRKKKLKRNKNVTCFGLISTFYLCVSGGGNKSGSGKGYEEDEGMK